jgi:hypothetical protein
VTPRYFAATGIPIRAGRDFSTDDLSRPFHHVIINESLARRLFGSANPIGRRLALGGDSSPIDWHEIIGVVGDVRHRSLAETPEPRAYDLVGEHWSRTMFVIVRGPADALSFGPLVRDQVRRLDPQAPVFEQRTLEGLRDEATASRRVATVFGAGTAGVSVLLAGIGIYGLLAGTVAARTRELAIRRALGSSPGGILTIVLGEGMALSLLGVTGGIVLALSSGRAIQAQLFGIAATDLRVISSVAVLLLAVSALASLGPAARASNVDPAIVLRAEE